MLILRDQPGVRTLGFLSLEAASGHHIARPKEVRGSKPPYIDCQRALMICEEEGCCLEQWCLYVYRLKSGFSRVDFGPLFIHDSWPPTAWAWVLPPDSG
jgi:hypothetical protein